MRSAIHSLSSLAFGLVSNTLVVAGVVLRNGGACLCGNATAPWLAGLDSSPARLIQRQDQLARVR